MVFDTVLLFGTSVCIMILLTTFGRELYQPNFNENIELFLELHYRHFCSTLN